MYADASQKYNFSDMIIVDGSEETIKKEDIMHIQEEFNKTALEATGKKIYILNRVENATADAMNALLKFLEEPASDVTAILSDSWIKCCRPSYQDVRKYLSAKLR